LTLSGRLLGGESKAFALATIACLGSCLRFPFVAICPAFIRGEKRLCGKHAQHVSSVPHRQDPMGLGDWLWYLIFHETAKSHRRRIGNRIPDRTFTMDKQITIGRDANSCSFVGTVFRRTRMTNPVSD